MPASQIIDSLTHTLVMTPRPDLLRNTTWMVTQWDDKNNRNDSHNEGEIRHALYYSIWHKATMVETVRLRVISMTATMTKTKVSGIGGVTIVVTMLMVFSWRQCLLVTSGATRLLRLKCFSSSTTITYLDCSSSSSCVLLFLFLTKLELVHTSHDLQTILI